MNIAPHLAGRGLEWFRQGRATDFADPVSLLGRTLVEGLFGLRPDYSQGVVTCAPQLPDDWDRARLEIPGFSLQASCSHGVSEYTLHLERPARVRWTLPVRGQEVMAVTLDGRPVPYELEPGYGETRLTIGAGESVTTATVRLHCTGQWVASSPLALEGLPGAPVALDWAAGQLTALEDPQGCLAGVETHGRGIQAILGTRPGRHLLLARLEQAGLPRYQPIDVHILTPAPDPWPAPETTQDWMPLDLSASFNADDLLSSLNSRSSRRWPATR